MIDLLHIKKDYYVDKKPFTALHDVSVSFPDRGFVAILGPSGCGKTTALNIIGGLDHYTSGDLLINGKSTKDYKDRDWDSYRNEQVGFVFQNYNLIPHQSVLSNVETSLLLNGVSRKNRYERAMAALKSVGLENEEKKKPNQLSGGQMQRVALARAIVNNPKIILADEPTGALDSVTSIQVMDILKEMSRTRLVVMVTHNSELAFKYATRVIKMKDGKIVEDSDPLPIANEHAKGSLETTKTSMSFLTALKSSFNNIRTKKARTILTAVASSIGIIGVALVLSLSNGFSTYVNNVEASIASSVPISIAKSTYTISSNDFNKGYEEYPSDNQVKVYDTSKSTFVSHTNFFSKEYIDKVLNPLVKEGLARSIMVNRQNLSFNLLKEIDDGKTKTYKEIDQYTSAGSTGSLLNSVTSLPATIFHELYGEEKGLSDMYDLIYGSYPKSSDELVLITDKYNRVELSTLKGLGIIPEGDTTTKSISFSDILNKNIYKAYLPSNFYQETSEAGYTMEVKSYENVRPTYSLDGTITYSGDKTTKTIKRFKDIDDTQEGYRDLYENDAKYNPKKLKIVGVLRPSRSSYITLMPSSIGYLSSLKEEFVHDTENNCKPLQEVASDCWYLPQRLDSSGNPTPDDGLKRLGSSMTVLARTLSQSNVTQSSDVPINLIADVAKSLQYEYFSTQPRSVAQGVRAVPSYGSYFVSNKWIGNDFREDLVGKFVEKLTSAKEEERQEAMSAFLAKLLSPSFYANSHENPFFDLSDPSINMDFNIVDLIAYFQSYSLISSILVFPSSLTTKDALKARLDAYNEGQNKAKQIVYSDVMSTFTSSLGTMINVISIVLVVFASISLVVSSIMTAIITYVSVVERTKEIGIMRACGARKKDVGRLFQAECVIIGLVAGVIGVGFTILADWPISSIIDRQFPGNGLANIASLNPWHGALLVVISVLLSFISGLIPARIGANKDPVTALRSE